MPLLPMLAIPVSIGLRVSPSVLGARMVMLLRLPHPLLASMQALLMQLVSSHVASSWFPSAPRPLLVPMARSSGAVVPVVGVYVSVVSAVTVTAEVRTCPARFTPPPSLVLGVWGASRTMRASHVERWGCS